MPKNSYKLQPLLDMRGRAKQEATRRVAARRTQLAEAEAELTQREQAVADCRAQQAAAQEEMMREVKGGVQARRVVAHRTHLADLRQIEQDLRGQLEQQKTVVLRAESELENALAALIEASKELQVIEKHRQEWNQRTQRAEQRRQQKLSDEIGSIIHGRQRRDEG